MTDPTPLVYWPPESDSARQSVASGMEVARWVGAFLSLSVVVGALAGLWWAQVSTLPTFVVHDDFSASTTELGLSQTFSTDMWFSVIGGVCGLGLGLVAWRWFSRLGWMAAVLATVGGLAAGAVCWAVGTLSGPGPFDVRLAAASPGDVVPVQFELHSPAALAVWTMAAVLPVMLIATLARDPEIRPRDAWTKHRPTLTRPPTQPGVTTLTEVVGRDLDPLAGQNTQARTEQARTEQARTEQARPEQARTEQARPEQARTEQARFEQARDVRTDVVVPDQEA